MSTWQELLLVLGMLAGMLAVIELSKRPSRKERLRRHENLLKSRGRFWTELEEARLRGVDPRELEFYEWQWAEAEVNVLRHEESDLHYSHAENRANVQRVINQLYERRGRRELAR